MNWFDTQFVYFEWNPILEGKQVYVSDMIGDLRERVDLEQRTTIVTEGSHDDQRFVDRDGCKWRFAYYDPNLACKKAYAEGAQIECNTSGVETDWHFIADPNWSKGTMYRVKGNLTTNYKLARWLASGGGQVSVDGKVSASYSYDLDKDNEPVPESIRVRAFWNEEDMGWHRPTQGFIDKEG